MTEKIKNRPYEKWAKVELNGPTKFRDYYVSNQGRLKAVHKLKASEREIKLSTDQRGFVRASIKLIDRYTAIFIHKAVAKAFVKQKSENHSYIIHKDIDRSNNHHTNVKWVNEKAWKVYVKARAEKYGFKKTNKGGYFKLKAGEVAEIKKLLNEGKTQKKAIAQQFNVSATQIARIEAGINWSHVEAAK